MALVCVAVRRDSVSFLRFLFLSYVQVFLCEISLVCRFKCPCSCFSSHFCSLVILFCWCPCCLYCFWSLLSVFLHSFLCCLLVVVSTLSWILASPLPLSFLGIYSLSTSSVEYKALYIVMSFRVLWSVGVLRWSTLRMVSSIPLMRFLRCSWVSYSFLVVLR